VVPLQFRNVENFHVLGIGALNLVGIDLGVGACLLQKIRSNRKA
jgi:hypothetical protein